jgi:lipopolysaccharide exporter
VSLAKKAVAGFLWTVASNLGARVITVGSTFVLTRFLAPEVQGEVNVAVVCVATLGWATSFGVGQYVAVHPKADRSYAFHGALLMIASGLAMIGVCVALREPAGRWLNTPGMSRFIPGLAVSQFIDRFGALPRGILARDLRFKTIGARVLVGELTYALCSMGFAALGWGGHAIVGANLARAVLAFGFLAAVTDRRDYFEPAPFDPEKMRAIMRFGLPVSISYIFHSGSMMWDNLFIASRFGAATNGLYQQAYQLANLPASNVGEQINDALVPTFARVEDPAARARGLRRATGLLALVVFPMSAGLSAVAEPLVRVFYAPSYAGVAPFLVALAPLSMARSVATLLAGYMQVLGKTRAFIALDIILIVALFGSMFALAPLGPTWAVLGVGIGFFVNVVTMLWSVRSEGVRVLDVAGAALRPLLACAPMVGAVLGVRSATSSLGLPAAARLGLEISAGALAYVAAAFVFAPAIVRDFLDLALSMVRKRRAKAAPAAEEVEPAAEG